MVLRIILALAGALIACTSPAAAQMPAADILQPGITRLKPTSYVYVPKGVAHPAPLIVLLHGAGGNARSFLDLFKHDAESRGTVLLSLQSSGRTWPTRAPTEDDQDVKNLNQTLRVLLAQPLVDQRRMTVMGFSDGASYALSLGLAQPDLFRTIVAMSPGYAFAPARPDTTQRIFIAHGRRDQVLPVGNVRDMVEGLESAGYAPQIRWFNGRHEIDPSARRDALDFALGATRTPR